jgi:hypothetical protein
MIAAAANGAETAVQNVFYTTTAIPAVKKYQVMKN